MKIISICAAACLVADCGGSTAGAPAAGTQSPATPQAPATPQLPAVPQTPDPGVDVTYSHVVTGAILDGVTVHVAGPVTVDAVTSDRGSFDFTGPLVGTYTYTPSAAGFSFFPSSMTPVHDGIPLRFISTPPSTPSIMHVAGDAASGVTGGDVSGATTFASPSALDADLAVFDPATNFTTFRFKFSRTASYDPDPAGAELVFVGRPAAGTSSGTPPPGSKVVCWSTDTGSVWAANDYSLRIDSVGPEATTNLDADGEILEEEQFVFPPVSLYAVHGSFQATCAPKIGTAARGTVTMNGRF
jgi:hypothetical protein